MSRLFAILLLAAVIAVSSAQYIGGYYGAVPAYGYGYSSGIGYTGLGYGYTGLGYGNVAYFKK